MSIKLIHKLEFNRQNSNQNQNRTKLNAILDGQWEVIEMGFGKERPKIAEQFKANQSSQHQIPAWKWRNPPWSHALRNHISIIAAQTRKRKILLRFVNHHSSARHNSIVEIFVSAPIVDNGAKLCV